MRNFKQKLYQLLLYLNSIEMTVKTMTVVVAGLSIITAGFLYLKTSREEFPVSVVEIPVRPKPQIVNDKVVRPKPGPLSMKKMKTRGCVADGILSGYYDADEAIDLINRSECRYLHRAIETWRAVPDFELADELINKFTNRDMVYGMFIAEAINKKSKFYYPDEDRRFDFYKMCRPGSQNAWGEHTCKPSFEKKEYRKYVTYIMKRGIDLGVQSFMFGQIHYQDTPDLEKSQLPELLAEMREYAKDQGVQIAIGAQTNSITDEKYLRQFDYIEGGVGVDISGNIEDGPCLGKRESCWALLWHDQYAKKANNVFLHLDWTGIKSDDMSIFARMDKETRAKTLKKLYSYFTDKKNGIYDALFCYAPSPEWGMLWTEKKILFTG